MKMTEMIKNYRLPNPSTVEDLEMMWVKVLVYGDKVLLTGRGMTRENGKAKYGYYGAVYEFLDDDNHDIDSPVGVREVSEGLFEDEGHAIEWAMQQ